MPLSPIYKLSVALGTGKQGEEVLAMIDAACEKLALRNADGKNNYSALFRIAVKHVIDCPTAIRNP